MLTPQRLTLLGLMLCSLNAAAEEVTPPSSPWKAAADVGYIRNSGSSGSKETFKGKVFGEYRFTQWSHEAKAEAIAINDDEEDSTGTERYLAGTKSKRSFTPMDYLFIQTQWEKDLESDFDYQAFVSTGYGRHLIKNEVHQLSAEIGAGWRHSEPKAAEPTDEAIGNFNLNYLWQIEKDTSFVQKVAVEAGRENVVTRSLTELKHKLNAALAAGVSYDYKHDDGDTNSREGIFSFNLSYVFR